MADFEFPIPLSREDLLRRNNLSQYVVDEVLPVRMLPGELQGKTRWTSVAPFSNMV